MASKRWRSKPRATLWAFLASVLLAGCSALSPPSGDVVAVRTMTSAIASPGAAPPRPLPGLAPDAVALGFLTAMNQGRASGVAPWVQPAERAAVSAWAARPPEVYSALSVGAASVAGTTATVPLYVQLQGHVVPPGYWSVQATTTVGVVKLAYQNGSWQVARLPSTPMISATQFRAQWTRSRTFLVAPDGRHLTPLPLLVALPPTATPVAVAHADLRALLTGRYGGVASGLRSAIPSGTRLLGFDVRNQVAQVDLSGAFGRRTGLAGSLRVGQIVWTVANELQTVSVHVLVDGRPAGTVGPDAFRASGTWRPQTPPLAMMAPAQLGNHSTVLFSRPDGRIGAVGTGESGSSPVVVPVAVPKPTTAPNWAPDGRHFAFLAPTQGGRRLWIAGHSGRVAHPTAAMGALSAASWLPDGSALLVLRRTGSQTQLLRVAASAPYGVQRLALAPLPGSLQPVALSVSPSGALVAVVGALAGSGFSRGGQVELGVLSAAGVTQWLPSPAPSLGTQYRPVWLDASRMAFVSRGVTPGTGTTLPPTIWTVGVDGWGPARVATGVPSGIVLGTTLATDPTGQQLIFSAQTGPGSSLYEVSRYGMGLRVIAAVARGMVTAPSLASQ